MKSLTAYIKESQQDCYEVNNFEDYCKLNNIKGDQITEDVVNRYCDSLIAEYFDFRGYDWWQFYLYEALTKTLESETLVKHLKKEFEDECDEIIEMNVDSIFKTIKITSKNARDISTNKILIQLANRANYEILYDGDYEPNYIYLKPKSGEDVSDKVYSYPEIYHITSKEIYEKKIKDYGLVPKHKRSKLSRIYFYYAEDRFKGSGEFARLNKRSILKNNEYNSFVKKYLDKGYVLLTIDLSKISKRRKFFEDSGSKNKNCFWTSEFIPNYAITKVEDVDMNRIDIPKKNDTMKSLVQYIKEARYKNMYDGPEFFDDEKWDLGYKYYNNDTDFPSLEEIENAFAAKDMDDNPSVGGIELHITFRKVGKDRWDVIGGDHHMLGRSFTDKKILDMISSTKDKWYLMLRSEK